MKRDRRMLGEVLSLLMFVFACLTLMAGFPVAFTLGGVALFFAMLGTFFDVFNDALLNAIPSRYFGVMVNEILVAVPLFVFMGVMMERSKIAENLLETMSLCIGRLRGGLGISVTFVGMLLAASTGIVGATVVTMGLLSLPTMLKAGYDPKLATGIICASGTLGQIIPPSIVLVLLGDVLQGANTQAQIAMGNWGDSDGVTVVDLFVGAFIPGLLLVLFYMAWIVLKAFISPQAVPMGVPTGQWPDGFMSRLVKSLLAPFLLIFAVLGSILCGIAAPTEGAAVGAFGAIVLAASSRHLNMDVLRHVMRETMKISAMVFVILLGASIFSLVFRGLGGDEIVEQLLTGLPGGKLSAIFAVMALMFILGFFLDFIEIVFVVVPIVGPVLLQMDINPVWLGVMIAINLQTSFLTPPFGFALFYLRGVAPKEVRTSDIYKGVIPFVIIQLLMLIILAVFPQLVIWLPETIL